MKLKAAILSTIVALACVATCAAQEKKRETPARPDFSGTWVLDRSKSVGGSGLDSTLVITHRDPELRIIRTDVRKSGQVTREYTYYTDGRGETNPFYYGDGRFASKTKWKGDRVEADECVPTGDDRCRSAGTTQKWQLSADGRTLTHTTSYVLGGGYNAGGINMAQEPGQPGEIKLVYRHAP